MFINPNKAIPDGLPKAMEKIRDAEKGGAKELDLSNLHLGKLDWIVGSEKKISTLAREISKLKNITSLKLSGNGLRYLPEALCELTDLITLNLGFNQLTKLPAGLHLLSNLQSLSLDGNEFTLFPEEICNLYSLISLDISRNKITALPSSIGQLSKLHTFIVHDNELTALPAEIGLLTSLTVLFLSANRLESLPSGFSHLTNLKAVYLSSNKFDTFPIELCRISSLETVHLTHNQISSVPTDICTLKNLRSLSLGYNLFEEVPAIITRLTGLQELDFSDGSTIFRAAGKASNNDEPKGNLLRICEEIGELENLTSFDLYNNQITQLPASMKNLKKLYSLDLNNNLLSVPPEILEKVTEPQTILEYYFSSSQRSLNECKVLVVGQGSVGKTSLIQQILANKFDPNENKTEGIDIRHYNFKARDISYSINVWDFGGQEIMHATHQFFLTKRSLYLLVLDSRLTQEENRVEYWIKMIQSFGGGSPVLMVGNKTDQHPLDIDKSGLQKKYPNIVGIYETSAATGQGIDGLRSAIAQQVQDLPHVHDILPETWFTVKRKIESIGREKNFIQQEEFVTLCQDNEITEDSSQRSLIGFMHDLGVVLHFQDDQRLEALGILNPQWVTNGVYKILNSPVLFEKKGILRLELLNEILNLPEYPRDKRLFIVDMMKKFELCYDILPDRVFLVPDLLPKDEPTIGSWDDSLAFQYHYAVLPSSIITRFIVRMNEFIYKTVWRSGVVLQNGENTALVKADMEDKKVYIWINGMENTRRDFLSVIRSQFEIIHKTIPQLEVREKVPVPDSPAAVVDFEHLLVLEQKGVNEFIPEGMRELVLVRQLLNGVSTQAERERGNVTINIQSMDGSNITVGDQNDVRNRT